MSLCLPKEETEYHVPNNTLEMFNFVIHLIFIVKFGLVFNTWWEIGGILVFLLNMKKDIFPFVFSES